MSSAVFLREGKHDVSKRMFLEGETEDKRRNHLELVLDVLGLLMPELTHGLRYINS
jgi:hypothetical protein